jgi:hypothetical protein
MKHLQTIINKLGAFLLAALLLPLLFTAGCADGGDGPSGAVTGGFVPVTGIVLPATAETYEPVNLAAAAVEPANATNKTIIWTLNQKGTTSAKLTDATITFAAAGTANLTARIPNGTEEGEPYVQNFDITVTDPYDLKTVFEVTEEYEDGVTETFNAVCAYLRDTSEAELKQEGKIRLGSYIDLPSLFMLTYTADGYYASTIDLNDRPINDNNLFVGRLLRLIVVGINSFYPGRGSTPAAGPVEPAYQGGFGDSAPFPHLVFMFQNCPASSPWAGLFSDLTYANSFVRKYLAPVAGAAGSGQFLAALIESGVPADALFAPKRHTINSRSATSATGTDLIEDKLWLPTMREMFGFDYNPGSDNYTRSNDAYETPQNQARLEYYQTNESRIKYNVSNAATIYYTASPKSDDAARLCEVIPSGAVGPSGGSPHPLAIAPAFCVKAAQ